MGGMEWERMGWDEEGRDGMRRVGMGWIRLGKRCFYTYGGGVPLPSSRNRVKYVYTDQPFFFTVLNYKNCKNPLKYYSLTLSRLGGGILPYALQKLQKIL